jgi:hypothetical protein
MFRLAENLHNPALARALVQVAAQFVHCRLQHAGRVTPPVAIDNIGDDDILRNNPPGLVFNRFQQAQIRIDCFYIW